MTKNEFIEKIENGSDIMFDAAGKHFSIFTWMDEGIGIGEQYPHDGNMQYFDTAQALVEHFMIGNKPLSDYINTVVITDYT